MAETPDQLSPTPNENEPAAGTPADQPGEPLAGFIVKNGWLQLVKPGYQPALPAATELAELAEHFRAVTDATSLARVLNAALELHRKQHPKGRTKTVAPGLLLYYAHHKKERYRTFQVPKRTRGQFRDIKAPEHGLLRIQRLLLLCLTATFTTCDEAAHGFVPGRSVLTNAQPHAGRRFVLNLDLKDFFPSTRVGRVLKVLQMAPFNLPKEAAHLVANLCCDQGSLPQGAPTSPLLTNVVCMRLDRKLRALAKLHRCRYTRYADDITFSSQRPAFTPAFHAELNAVLAKERYEQNPAKQRLQTPENRQEVTGVVVNERPNVPREFVQDIRFLLHVWQKHGYTAASEAMGEKYGRGKAHARYKGNIPKLEKVLAGKIAYLGMVKGSLSKDYSTYFGLLQELKQGLKY